MPAHWRGSQCQKRLGSLLTPSYPYGRSVLGSAALRTSAPGDLGALPYLAALKSANAAASSPLTEACQALAAETARRSRYSRMASATSAERLPPAAAAFRSSPRPSSSVIEMLTVASWTLPTTVPPTRSAIASACHRTECRCALCLGSSWLPWTLADGLLAGLHIRSDWIPSARPSGW
jgi:hypothetical protein